MSALTNVYVETHGQPETEEGRQLLETYNSVIEGFNNIGYTLMTKNVAPPPVPPVAPLAPGQPQPTGNVNANPDGESNLIKQMTDAFTKAIETCNTNTMVAVEKSNSNNQKNIIQSIVLYSSLLVQHTNLLNLKF